MARPKNPLLTDREAEIMAFLWDAGSGTAEQIRERLSGDPHDSTVRTLLRVLATKGHVTAAADSRPTVYRPAVKRANMQKRVTRDVLKRFFGGSAEALVLHLLDDERLTADELKDLEAAFRRARKET
jgi:BlaI family transcriptional regulator, penicillinase repressor